jgi:hypothetical protein
VNNYVVEPWRQAGGRRDRRHDTANRFRPANLPREEDLPQSDRGELLKRDAEPAGLFRVRNPKGISLCRSVEQYDLRRPW